MILIQITIAMDQDVLPSARHRRGRGHHRVARSQGGIRRVAPRTAAKLRGQQRGRGQVDSCQVQ